MTNPDKDKKLRALLAEALGWLPEDSDLRFLDHVDTVSDLRARITAALEGGKDGGGWLPIETAPLDGTRILVHFKRHGWVSCFWDSTSDDLGPASPYALWHVDDFKHGPYPVRGYVSGDDTHWQPLPPLPKGE